MVVPSRERIVEAASNLAACQRLLVLTGAGSSAEAGVPTFRDNDGLWRQHRWQDLASRGAFERDPEMVWDWYRDRRLQVAGCQPHAGQRALALLDKHLPADRRVLIATTNEDDLLERAGVHPVVHLHGSLFDTRCVDACGWSARDATDNSLSFLSCPRCGADVRPGSVWFGEPLGDGSLQAVSQFDADGCLIIGSSSLVQPVAAIAPELALAGGCVIEVNPQPTPLSRIAGMHLQGAASEILPPLVDLLTSATLRGQPSQA